MLVWFLLDVLKRNLISLRLKKEETSYEYTPTIIDTNGITFIATEHNTFECAVSIHEMIYKVTSEPGSVALIKNNVVNYDRQY